MILGDVCTRSCRFCATRTGRPLPPDDAEPGQLARSVKLMGLRHVVVTSVTRDDLPDGGAPTGLPPSKPSVERITTQRSSSLFQISTPARAVGHGGGGEARYYRAQHRNRRATHPAGAFARPLRDLAPHAGAARTTRRATKSGLMLGLGESDDEVLQTLHDLRRAGVRIVTLGQYLRPTLEHYPVAEYITPEKFEAYRQQALAMGFDYCASAPMVRSSYRARKRSQQLKMRNQRRGISRRRIPERGGGSGRF